MNEESLIIVVAITTLLVILVVAVVFLVSQQKLLSAIQPDNREISPGSVWLQLIPVFGMIYQFIVVNRISNSVTREIESRTTDSVILPEISINLGKRPLYSTGIAYCTLFCCGMIPIIGGVFSLAGFICWIIYWVQLVDYRKKIEAVAPVVMN